jgi:hypothetical protein
MCPTEVWLMSEQQNDESIIELALSFQKKLSSSCQYLEKKFQR